MIGSWKILQAWWADDDTAAGYPGSPGGQVPTLQTNGTVKWETPPGASGGGTTPTATLSASSTQTLTGNSAFQDIQNHALSGALQATITTVATGTIVCLATVRFRSTASAQWDHNRFRFLLDGATGSQEWTESIDEVGSTSDYGAVSLNPIRVRTFHGVYEAVAAGAHTVKLQWHDSNSGQDIVMLTRQITIWSNVVTP